MSAPVLQARGVFCVHRTGQGDAAALQGLDLDLAGGEVLCVLGPSGAGKSTLLRVAAGLQLPSAGVVSLLGRDIGRLDARRRAEMRHRHVGFLGQSSETLLAPGLTAERAAVLPLALRGVERQRRQCRAAELLEAVGLRGRADAFPAELSGGERQRLALCAALAHAPDVLLADEPTGELDRSSAESLYQLVVALIRSAGASAIIASHDPLAAHYADRTVTLSDGRIVEEQTGGTSRLVIDHSGWVRLPAPLRRATKLGNRVRARAADGGLLLSAGDDPGCSGPASYETPTAPAACVEWTPAQLDVVDLTRSFTQGGSVRLVLGSLTHAFGAGRLTVVTGRSGSGKTTLLKLIAGLDRPDAGEIVLDGDSLAARDGEGLAGLRRQRIGFMPQDPAPVAFLSAQENVVLTLRIRGWDQPTAEHSARVVLEAVGLSERARQRVGRLSAGETQRVALARALAAARGLLVVDEPTSRLDEDSARRVSRLLAQAASGQGQTIVCASHDPRIIACADEQLNLD